MGSFADEVDIEVVLISAMIKYSTKGSANDLFQKD